MKNQTKNQARPELFYIYGTAARPHIQGEALAQAMAAYSDQLQEEARKRGAAILQHNPAQGYWQGEAEPSFKTVILAERSAAFQIAQALRAEHDQDAILLIEPNPSGQAALLSVSIPSSKGEEEAREAVALEAYTITGGAVEILSTDGDQAEAEAVAAAIGGEVERISGAAYFITAQSSKQERKQERKQQALTAITGKTQEEREAEAEAAREEEARAQAEAEAERKRAVAREVARAHRAAAAQAALDAIGYGEEREAVLEPGRILEVIS
jgi:hypothetical protein